MYIVYENCEYEGIQSVIGYCEDESDAIAIVDRINKAKDDYKDKIDEISQELHELTNAKFNQKYPEYAELDFYSIKDIELRLRLIADHSSIQEDIRNELRLDCRLALAFDGRTTIMYSNVKELKLTHLKDIC